MITTHKEDDLYLNGIPLGEIVRTGKLSAMELYVLSLRAAGWKQREIAKQVRIAQPHISRMLARSIRKMRKAMYQIIHH